jgi:hypothetical protein
VNGSRGRDLVGIASGSALAWGTFFIQAPNIEAVWTEYTYIRAHRVSSNAALLGTRGVKDTRPTVH